MALPSTAVFEVRQGASDLNGGGFNPSRGGKGVDRSQQDGPHVDIDNGELVVTVHTTTTQVSGTFLTVSTADLGNFLQITGGTATAGVYEITAVDTINRRWTLDRSAGTAGQTIVGRMGGAFATPGFACGIATSASSAAAYSTIWVRGTHQITSSSSNVSNGRLALPSFTQLRGYGSTRGDGVKATLNAAIASITVVTVTSSGINNGWVRDIAVTNTGVNVNVTGFDRGSGSNGFAIDCSATACSTGFTLPYCIRCVASSGTIGFAPNQGVLFACIANGNTSHGFGSGNGNPKTFDKCIAYGNGGAGFVLSDGGNMSSCTSYNNTSHGISVTGGTQAGCIIGCLLVNNGGAGESGSQGKFIAINNATYNNTGGAGFSGSVNSGNIALAAAPFVNAASGNFALNSTAGGGAACKAAGIPGAFPSGLTTGYLDIGAVQSQASTAGYPRGVNV